MPNSFDSMRNGTTYDDRLAAQYAALWAFGYLNGLGHSEGLYRTLGSLAFERLPSDRPLRICDYGCGVGRLSADLAVYFSASHVIGVDSAPPMIHMAREIVCGEGPPISLELDWLGFGRMGIPRLGLSNVSFRCETGESLCDRIAKSGASTGAFDLILASNVLDRVNEPLETLSRLRSILMSNGLLIGSCPFNMTRAADWERLADMPALLEEARRCGFEVELAFDNFTYRELLDARGSYSDYRTCIFVLRRR